MGIASSPSVPSPLLDPPISASRFYLRKALNAELRFAASNTSSRSTVNTPTAVLRTIGGIGKSRNEFWVDGGFLGQAGRTAWQNVSAVSHR
jgi:hypothetical protein